MFPFQNPFKVENDFLLKADGKQFKRKVKLHQNTALAHSLEKSSFVLFSIKHETVS